MSSLQTQVFILQHVGQTYAIRMRSYETVLLSVLSEKLQTSIRVTRPHEENRPFLIYEPVLFCYMGVRVHLPVLGSTHTRV